MEDSLKQEILEFEKLENEATLVDHSYTADDIQVLEGLEAVRMRPGMYIGSTSSRGLHHLVWEIVDNGIDEALAGFASQIDVTIEKDDIIAVRDNGRGMLCRAEYRDGKENIKDNPYNMPRACDGGLRRRAGLFARRDGYRAARDNSRFGQHYRQR